MCSRIENAFIIKEYMLKCYIYIFSQWFLDRMADDDWWPMQILIKCPNQIVRQVR